MKAIELITETAIKKNILLQIGNGLHGYSQVAKIKNYRRRKGADPEDEAIV